MKFDPHFDAEPICDLPMPARIRVERNNSYGSVPGLPDDELADPGELMRMADREDWGPILRLPDLVPRNDFQPDLDEFGHVDGAFGSVDFARLHPRDETRSMADFLKREIRFSRIRYDMAMDELPNSASHKVLDYYRRDVVELDHITDDNMRIAARMDARLDRLHEESRTRRVASWEKRNDKSNW